MHIKIFISLLLSLCFNTRFYLHHIQVKAKVIRSLSVELWMLPIT